MSDYAHILSELNIAMPTLELRENEPMREHCSFRIGGPARAMALPASIDELQQLCIFLREKGEKPLVIGNGTNLLITDGPLDRFVIKLGDMLSDIERRSETNIYALCGISLARLASQCAKWSLTGLEFAHGIPGTLGGAVSMNAGAYGGEMKDVLISAMYLDEDANLRNRLGEELDLSYRHSAFSDTDCVILGAEIELTSGTEDEITAKMRELAEKRRSSQPLDMPSAGSTFKRPVGGYAAALIEQAGLKGFSIGGAMVSEKHAGFVVNRGDATFYDVLALIEHVQNTVFARTGITLEPEIKIIR